VLVACVSLVARAEPSPATLTEARSLFAEARTLEATGDYLGAGAKLEAALAIKETPGLRYHLAHCQEQTGAFVAASVNYERAAALVRAGALAPDVEPLLPLAARRLAARIAWLELLLPAGAGASVELDGRELDASGSRRAVPVDPGPHRLLVRSPGHADFQADLTFSSAEHRSVRVLFDSPGPVMPAGDSLRHRPAAGQRATPASRTSASGLGAREAVLLGEAVVSLTGLGLGIGFMVVRGSAARDAESAQASVDAHSFSTSPCASTSVPACAELDRALDEHRRATNLATASFVGAGVAALALGLTWALWPATPSTRASLALRPQAGGIELRAGGVF
jgi:hypothetical protein